MPVSVIYILLFTITGFLFSLFYAKGTLGSDQAIHLLFINLIRENGHKFIREVRSFIIQPKMTYPQLLHWALSFVPQTSLPFISAILPGASAFASVIAFLVFVVTVSPCLEILTGFRALVFLSGLLFITTPFTYNINNAKNAGISARGIGLFLGQVYTYGIVLYQFNNSSTYLVMSGVASLLILMSSQFASQYILFGSVIMSLLYWSVVPLIPVVAGAAIYFLILPKIALQFFKGNYGHKRFYFKHLAQAVLLSYRESIWKDVFFEIWRLIFTRQKPKGGGTLFMYVYNNPVVILIFSLPLAIPIGLLSVYNITDVSWKLAVPLIMGLILFILTSFRKTRFLGEPERYVEFSIGLTSILVVMFFRNENLVYLIISYQVIMVFLQSVVFRKRASVKSKGIVESVRLIDQRIDESNEAGQFIRLLSNNTEIMRSLATSRRCVFYPSLYSEWYGKFYYSDIYKRFDEMYSDKIVSVIREMNINRFVLDTDFFSRDGFNKMIKSDDLEFRELAVHSTLVLYEVIIPKT